MVIGVVVSIYYYFGWVREICFEPKPRFSDDDELENPWNKLDKIGLLKWTILICALISLFLVFGRVLSEMPSSIAFVSD